MSYLMNMYLKCGDFKMVLSLWQGIPADLVTDGSLHSTVLTACAKLGTPEALEVGKKIDQLILSSPQISILL